MKSAGRARPFPNRTEAMSAVDDEIGIEYAAARPPENQRRLEHMDDNPYRTPQADVEVAERPARSVWWKIYFVVYMLLLVMSLPDLLLDAGTGVWDFVYLPFLFAASLGLFGFVFMKRIFTAPVWLPVLVAVVGADILYPYLTDVDLSAGMSETAYLVSAVIGWSLSIPNYVALYLYSKPGNPIWYRQHAGTAGAPDAGGGEA